MDTWNWQHFEDLIDGYKLGIFLSLVFANVALGMAISVLNGQWRMKAMGDFLLKRVIPLGLGYIVIAVLAMADSFWETSVVAVWGVITAVLVATVLGQLKELGLPLPTSLLPFYADKPATTKTKTSTTPPSPPGR